MHPWNILSMLLLSKSNNYAIVNTLTFAESFYCYFFSLSIYPGGKGGGGGGGGGMLCTSMVLCMYSFWFIFLKGTTQSLTCIVHCQWNLIMLQTVVKIYIRRIRCVTKKLFKFWCTVNNLHPAIQNLFLTLPNSHVPLILMCDLIAQF